jgi:hypothetical protein
LSTGRVVSQDGPGTAEGTSGEVVDTSARQHGVVLDLGAAEGRAVGGDEDQLGLALTQGLQGRLVPQAILAALHDQGQAGVDGLGGLFLSAGKGDTN